jgi:hypothetical protein
VQVDILEKPYITDSKNPGYTKSGTK